ncbi:MAG: tetratricopeptide repeat protein [Chthoniobacterales bacterium]|nr:tetratricopeptide repeat protein [Chthoniobacterales bacterium]
MPEQQVDPEDKTELALEIAHLLFIDVVGYSKLLVNDQVGLMRELNRIVRGTECFRDAEASEKMIRLSTGDGMVLLFFRSPEQPVRCALQISDALRNRPEIKLRMGIHSGPVNQVMDVNDQINMAGAGINTGQRVMDCGDAGHILLSKHIADDLTPYRHWQPLLHDLGECEVKHGFRLHIVNLHKEGVGNSAVPEKLRRLRRWKRRPGITVRPVSAPRLSKSVWILAVLLSGVALFTTFWILYRRGPLTVHGIPAPSEKSIAVLPFENRSEEKANAYFTDGVQDEILTRLSKIADLKVISRTSTQHYKSAPENLRDIARQLGVAYIVEGSVQKSGETVRINVQLIKAANDSHLWAETFDRKLTDIFSVETEVARTIAEQLRARVSGEEKQVLAAKPTKNPEAYDAYLRGLAYTLKTVPTLANALEAQKYLKEAVRLDPDFALSWALLSIVDSRSYLTQALPPTLALREEAREAAETALKLQPNLGEAVWAKGFYHYACLKDYDTAVRYLEEARQLLPNNSRIPESLGYVERRRGQWERSERYLKEAERLDPRNVSVLTGLATNYICLRRFPEAVRKLEEVLDFAPDDLDTLAFEANIAQAEGDLPRAATYLSRLQPGADDSGALQIQVYQAILERNPAQIIPRLTEILAQPDPILRHVKGEMRFWLGWARDVAGDHAGAQDSWGEARRELESVLAEQPDNYTVLSYLALICMGLGEKPEAIDFSERAMAANPVEKDAVRGPFPVEVRARLAARMGDRERALAVLEHLLVVPYYGAMGAAAPLTPALLRLDPMFDSLRNDPRFQKLVGSTE